MLWYVAGNAYAQIIRNGKGEVIGLYPLMPGKMTVDRDQAGRICYLYNRTGEDGPTLGRDNQLLTATDVLHIPGLGFDGLIGYSPILFRKSFDNGAGIAG